MQILNLIEKKRDGEPLSQAEIQFFIRELTAGRVPDYQTAALLMAITLNGMTRAETVAADPSYGAVRATCWTCPTSATTPSTSIPRAASATIPPWSCCRW